MSTKLRICIITNRFPASQDDVASPFVKDFYLGLKKEGIDTFVFTPAYNADSVEEDENVFRFDWAGGEKVIGSLSFSNPKELYHIRSFLSSGKTSLGHFVKEKQINRIMALWALPSGWFAYWVKEKLRIPYSVWCLGSDIYVWAKKPILKGIIRKVLLNADYLFADGFELKDKVEKLSGKSCGFLPSVRILPKTDIVRTEIDKGKTNFIYVGRWEKEKGVDDLINAFKSVSQKHPQTHLYVIGWGSYENQMRELIRKFNLTDRIGLLGKVSAVTLGSYLKACSCTVISSKRDSIPLVFSESLQASTPLIVTEVGDMGMLVRKFGLGKVVPPGNVGALAEAMNDFAEEGAKDYSENIKQALGLLSIRRAIEDYLKMVDKDIGFP